ncbi:hypothetical protein [uncultured Duncaniella sp.]|uniref:hypothetical protein n=1 Tax=uncultured Duncaniella sp. TaxID=2768039 RepID=UPI0027339254|nr:hypothetical protein [uncultured Duncaniella sp.]
MSNRQIAHLMGVEQASAVKSRYRLHSRLGLSKGDSLEDELRRPDVGSPRQSDSSGVGP